MQNTENLNTKWAFDNIKLALGVCARDNGNCLRKMWSEKKYNKTKEITLAIKQVKNGT